MLAFWYSLGFAVVRTLLTIFVASSINDYERKIVTALRDVPSRAWSIEVEVSSRLNTLREYVYPQVQRFSEQLGNDTTALSGSGFFYLTRSLVLAVRLPNKTFELLFVTVYIPI